jgi:hypothetical protein
MTRVGDDLVCDRCLERNYSRCEECEDWYLTEDVTRCEGSEILCDGCLEEHASYCEECNEWRHNDDGPCEEHADDDERAPTPTIDDPRQIVMSNL